MGIFLKKIAAPPSIKATDWSNWTWQQRHSLKSMEDFKTYFSLTAEEEAYFTENQNLPRPAFRSQTTPFYAALANSSSAQEGIRRILVPSSREFTQAGQQLYDPLGEKKHSPVRRIVHRYPDRVLFLVTDRCAIYCRYCTRKHFTGQQQGKISAQELQQGINYIKEHPGVREVILSGGDPLTLGNSALDEILESLRAINTVEIIRIGSRMPIVNPFRMTSDLAKIMRRHSPVFLMTHFNHPDEITAEAGEGLSIAVDHGIPVMNQMVLLNGINNHPALIQSLSRRLLYLRVKPYYMFQCDPSMGTDHFRTSVKDSLEIQRELWGRLSGLAMPNLSLDIPEGGGKVTLVPNFLVNQTPGKYNYKGWDGRTATYEDPSQIIKPPVSGEYLEEWEAIKHESYGSTAADSVHTDLP